MEHSPLAPDILFRIGPVPISRAVVVTWAIMGLLAIGLGLASRRFTADRPGPVQAALEILVVTIADQVRQIANRDPWDLLPIPASLFVFLVLANLSAVVPGVSPPTGHIETPAALALVVFLSAHAIGLRSRGARRYLHHYLEPSPLLLPLNILSELTRSFSLMVRLFGNMMSHEFVLAIIVVLAGLLVPVPFMLLGVLIGIVQAYIFAVLATVYIAAAIGAVET